MGKNADLILNSYLESEGDRAMIDRDMTLLLIGTILGLVSAIIGALIQHSLSLRADRIKRERDIENEKERAMREIARKAEPSFLRTARHRKWLSKRKEKK